MTALDQTHPVGSPREHASAPRIAVIISCYNYETYVGKAIESVLSQHCDECELLVVDDGSKDGSWAVIRQSGARAFRIENRGQPGACLYGVQATSAPFILFLDADDELRPGSLKAVLAALDDKVAKLQFPLVWVNSNGDVLMTSPRFKDVRDGHVIAQQVLRTSVYFSPPTSGNVFRRDVALLLDEIDPTEDGVDGTILFAAPFMGDIVSIARPLGLYRVHSQNQSGVGRSLEQTTIERTMRRHISRMTKLRAILLRLDVREELVDPVKTFYFRELEFMMSVTRGQRIELARLIRLLKSLWLDYLPFIRKAGLSALYLAAALSSSAKAKRLLEYRMTPSGRSPGGFLKLMLT